jgi:hypothetical protein
MFPFTSGLDCRLVKIAAKTLNASFSGDEFSSSEASSMRMS